MSRTPSLRSRASEAIGGSWRLSSFELSLEVPKEHGGEKAWKSVRWGLSWMRSRGGGAESWRRGGGAVTSPFSSPSVGPLLLSEQATLSSCDRYPPQRSTGESTHHLQKVLCDRRASRVNSGQHRAHAGGRGGGEPGRHRNRASNPPLLRSG
jgi:hypothetical protein